MKLTKAVWALLPATLQANFKPVIPDGKTEADAEEYDNGEEDAGALKRSLEAEREEKKRIAQERDALKGKDDDAARKAREDAEKKARESGDVAALEKSWKEKQKADEKAHKEALAAREREIARLALDTQVDSLAGNFTVPSAMKAAIRDRLSVEFDAEGKTVIRVKDATGAPSASTVEDFKKELLANPEYKGIIKASQGSGGGATPPGHGGGGGATPTKIDPNKASPSELVAHLKAKGVGSEE